MHIQNNRLVSFSFHVLTGLAVYAAVAPTQSFAQPADVAVPDDFPRFVVPGKAPEMDAMRRLFWVHYQPAGPLIPLWDEWMAISTLWPARGEGAALDAMHQRWAAALAGRRIDAEGYVSSQQHDGPAHAEGWPFPKWIDAGGMGWHFRGTGIAGYDAPLVTQENWTIENATDKQIGPKGWALNFDKPNAVITTPAFSIDARSAPWLRINWWASGLSDAKCYVEWTSKQHPRFDASRRLYFSPADVSDTAERETRTMIPLYRIAHRDPTITQFRIGFANSNSAHVTIKSIHTACDTRQTINNPNFVRGVREVFAWTGDVGLLQQELPHARKAMRFMMDEFDTQKRDCIYTTWVGHEGRTGVRIDADGTKHVVLNEGIGGNYWDLLPFGGEDALATIYYYAALLDLAELEDAAKAHADWNISTEGTFDPTALRTHARRVRAYGTKRFWNKSTGRFGTVDLDGHMHDFGWTFLNNEAIYYDFATPEQARSIRDWISGRRTVAGDTSTGDDIYHWRFGPRASTKRNIDYYFWGWSNPESIPFGSQVQDGGAVLGFSYHDLMTRLSVDGADDAANRLAAIAMWFDETQAAGGYRKYYGSDLDRGNLQGGNVPGGLGVDREFFESILVPQVMLYGFLGFHANVDGISVVPKLPKDWPELSITRIRYRDAVMSVTARRDGSISFDFATPSSTPIVAQLPSGKWTCSDPAVAIDGTKASISSAAKSLTFNRQ